MSRWILAAKVADCPAGTGVELVVDGQMVALFHVNGRFFALDGVCPHQGGPLGKGTLQGEVVTCPWHGWQFDVRSGQHQLNPRICQRQYATRIQGEDVWIDLA